jgi:hypothetical protein
MMQVIILGALVVALAIAIRMILKNDPGSTPRELGLAFVGGLVVGFAVILLQIAVESDLEAMVESQERVADEQRGLRTLEVNRAINDATEDEDRSVQLEGQDLEGFDLESAELDGAS